MNDFEETAVSAFLSYWPDKIEYSTLISRITNEELGVEKDSISIWYPFDNYPGEFVAELIETLHQHLIKTFQATV